MHKTAGKAIPLSAVMAWLNTSPECSSTKLPENLQLIQQQFEAEAAHWHRLNGAANEQTFALVSSIHAQMDELCKRVSDEKNGTGASYRQPAEAKIAARALDPGLLTLGLRPWAQKPIRNL